MKINILNFIVVGGTLPDYSTLDRGDGCFFGLKNPWYIIKTEQSFEFGHEIYFSQSNEEDKVIMPVMLGVSKNDFMQELFPLLLTKVVLGVASANISEVVGSTVDEIIFNCTGTVACVRKGNSYFIPKVGKGRNSLSLIHEIKI